MGGDTGDGREVTRRTNGRDRRRDKRMGGDTEDGRRHGGREVTRGMDER